MEKVSKLDIRAAFKALDDLEIPAAEEKMTEAERQKLDECFRPTNKTDSLLEDYYNVSSKEDLGEAAEERAEDIAQAKLARIEKIVDLDAESPEDIQPSYVGKTIIQCPQCMTMFYKDEKDIVPSEDDPKVVNVNEPCQHCGNISGYEVIGKVASVEENEMDKFEEQPAEEAEDELNLDFEAPEAEEGEEELNLEPVEETEEEVKESLNEGIFSDGGLFDKIFDKPMSNYLAKLPKDKALDLIQPILDKRGITDMSARIVYERLQAGETLLGILMSKTESLNEDLTKDLKDYNNFIAFLQATLKQDEEALEKAKKMKDNEDVIAAIERRIANDKADLEQYLPKTVKDKATADELPTAEEAGLEEPSQNEEEVKAESLTEGRIEDRPLRDDTRPELYGEDVTDKVVDLLATDFDVNSNVPISTKRHGADREWESAIEVLNIMANGDAIIGCIKPDAVQYRADRYNKKLIDNALAGIKSQGWTDKQKAKFKAEYGEDPEDVVIKNVAKDDDFDIFDSFIEYDDDDMYEALEYGWVIRDSNGKLVGAYAFEDQAKEELEKLGDGYTLTKHSMAELDNMREALAEAKEEEKFPNPDKHELVDTVDGVEIYHCNKCGKYSAMINGKKVKKDSIEEIKDCITGKCNEANEFVAKYLGERFEEAQCKVNKAITHSEDDVKQLNEASEAEAEINKFVASLEEGCNKELKEDQVISDSELKELENSEEFQTPLSDDEAEADIEYLRRVKDELGEGCNKKLKSLESVEEVRDEDLVECISKSLTNVYENVENFELTNCELVNGKFIVEGKINFKSGLSKDTKYIFTEAIETNGRVILKGINESLAKDGMFSLRCTLEDNGSLMIVENLGYKYSIGDSLVEGLAK